MELKLNEEIHALYLLSSLPDSWEALIVSYINYVRNGVHTLNMVNKSMLNEENKRKKRGISSGDLSVGYRKHDGVKARGLKNRDRSKSKRNR